MPMRWPRKRAKASSFRAPSLTPSTSTSPLSGRSRPAMIIKSVDLPEPEAPIMPTASPLSIVRSTSRKICTRAAARPRLRSTPRIATAGNTMSGHLKTKRPSYGHLLLLVQAVTFAAVLATASHAAAARTLHLVALGDSLTAGYGLPPGKAFPNRLEAALRANGWAVPADADALIVELGGNDMLRGMKPETTKAALAAILDKARAAHLSTLLAGMWAAPNLGPEYARRFSAIYSALATSYDVSLYPF